MASNKDTKDVKGSTGPVLPKSVLGSATAPKPRPRRKIVYEDYVSVDGEIDQLESDDDSKAGGIVPLPGTVPPPSASGEPSPVAYTDAELQSFLLREIAATGRVRHEGTLADSKHSYVNLNTTAYATGSAELAILPANITLGAQVTNRLTNTIRLRRIRIKMCFIRRADGPATSPSIIDPMIHVCVFRDKLPKVPGSVPVIHVTDGTPPTSQTSIFSRFGTATPENDRTMVRNPITEDLYHVYRYERYKWSNNQNLSGASLPQTQTEFMEHTMDIDLNDVKVVFPDAGSNPVVNQLSIVHWSDAVNNPVYGLTQFYRIVTDTEFYDVQDDA